MSRVAADQYSDVPVSVCEAIMNELLGSEGQSKLGTAVAGMSRINQLQTPKHDETVLLTEAEEVRASIARAMRSRIG